VTHCHAEPLPVQAVVMCLCNEINEVRKELHANKEEKRK
jgi:hypothetical protein